MISKLAGPAGQRQVRMTARGRRRAVAWRGLIVALALAFAVAPGATGQEPPTTRGTVRLPGRTGRQPAAATAPAAAAEELQPTLVSPASPQSTGPAIIEGPGEQKMIAMEFYDLHIDFLLRLLSREAGVTIVRPEEVTGLITVIAPEPVPLDQAFQILNSALKMRGFTMVQSATGIYEVLPIEEAAQSGLPLRFGNRPEDVEASDDVITQVIPLLNLAATDVASQIEGLVSANASIIPTATNSLIITDSSVNIQRVLIFIDDIETQLSAGLQVYQLQYYDATEMAQVLDAIVLSRGAAGGAGAARPAWERRVVPTRGPAPRPAARAAAPAAATSAGGPEFCYPDARTNSLIVLATPVHLAQIEELIESLDRPISLRDSYFVYPVQNLMASDLAQLIAPLVGAEVSTGTGAGTAGTTRSQPQSSTRTGTPFQRTSSSPRTSSRLSSRPEQAAGLALEPVASIDATGTGSDPLGLAQAPEGGPPSAPPTALQPGVATPAVPEAVEMAVSGVGQATIAADDNTNTLIFSGPAEQIELIQQLLAELDVLPPQVYIKVIIAEVSLTRDTSLGFQWNWLQNLAPYGGAQVVGEFTTNFGIGGTDDAGNPIATTPGLFGQLTSDEFQGVVTALTTDSNVRILSAPSIFTSNNQEAEITVSSSRPFPTGQLTSTTAAGVISTSIRYEPVGIVLRVTPRVTQGDIVRMEIQVNADEVGASVTVGDQEFPSKETRQASATLSCPDGHTVVLGGLMREGVRHNSTRVPLLGDLPLIGPLFRSSSVDREKSELLVFLTPHVVRSPAHSARLTEEAKSALPEVPRSLQAPADGSSATEGD